MPKRVDHDARRRQITDAVCRITLQGGLGAATFRQIAAEAGISVRLVQYYFGTKDALLETTLQHVGERSIARLTRWIEATDGSPRAVLEAFLKSFIPNDEESRLAMLMYIALAAENVVADRTVAAGHKRQTESQMMINMVVEQLERGSLRPGINSEAEALIVTGMMPGLGNLITEGMITPAEAGQTIDYHLDRLFAPEPGATKNAGRVDKPKNTKPKKSRPKKSKPNKSRPKKSMPNKKGTS